MANVYAVKTGNWSDTTVWNTGALPTSADDVYSNNFTVTIDQNVTVLSIRNESATSITAGGGFILNGSVTVNCTGLGIRNANTTCITFSSTGTSYINSTITNNGNANCVTVTSTGTLYIVGNILTTIGNNFATINATSAASTIYITGNLRASASSGVSCISVANLATFYITGNVSTIGSANANKAILFTAANGRVFITGNVFYEGGAGFNNSAITVSNDVVAYLNIVGTLNATSADSNQLPVIRNTNSSSVNLFSGPFISSPTGQLPIFVNRMHLIPTIGAYFEYRDSSTNGALPPAAAAPATRLVSPDTVVDAPVPANVRFGVTYALGTQTGTLRVPSPNSVAFGVLTDNTTGTAVLTPQAVWDYATSSLTTEGSIGERLKNASTVDTTGDQLAALL